MQERLVYSDISIQYELEKKRQEELTEQLKCLSLQTELNNLKFENDLLKAKIEESTLKHDVSASVAVVPVVVSTSSTVKTVTNVTSNIQRTCSLVNSGISLPSVNSLTLNELRLVQGLQSSAQSVTNKLLPVFISQGPSVQSQSESFKRPPQTLGGPETLGVNNSYCIPAVRVASSAVPHLNQSGLASQAKVGSWGNVSHQCQNVDHHPIVINERATIGTPVRRNSFPHQFHPEPGFFDSVRQPSSGGVNYPGVISFQQEPPIPGYLSAPTAMGAEETQDALMLPEGGSIKKLKSGADISVRDNYQRQILWPHLCYDTIDVKRNLSFSELSCDMLAAGELEIIEQLINVYVSGAQQDPIIIEQLLGRIGRLKDTMYYVKQHGLTKAKSYFELTGRRIEAGGKWTDDTREAYAKSFLSSSKYLDSEVKNLSPSRPRSNSDLVACLAWNMNDQCSFLAKNGRCTKPHVCSKCLTRKGITANHKSRDCPDIPKSQIKPVDTE